MVSTIVNMPVNVGTIKGLDCLSHGKFNLNVLPIRPSISSLPHRRMLVVKASTSDGSFKKSGMSDAECEAAVVAGNVLEAPPVPPVPASPVGTPVVTSFVSVFIFILTNLQDPITAMVSCLRYFC